MLPPLAGLQRLAAFAPLPLPAGGSAMTPWTLTRSLLQAAQDAAAAVEPPTAGAPGSFLGGLHWIDQAGLAILAVFLVLGAVRGLWWQVIRLAGLLFAGVLARVLAPRFSAPLAEESGLPLVVSQGLVWLTVFVLGLVVAGLLGTIGKKSLEALQLGLVDRTGGALAGLLSGVALHGALLVALSYLGPQPWTADTLRGTRSGGLLRLVSGRLPVFVDRDSLAAREIRSWIGSEGDGAVQAAPPAAGSAADGPDAPQLVPDGPAGDAPAPAPLEPAGPGGPPPAVPGTGPVHRVR